MLRIIKNNIDTVVADNGLISMHVKPKKKIKVEIPNFIVPNFNLKIMLVYKTGKKVMCDYIPDNFYFSFNTSVCRVYKEL